MKVLVAYPFTNNLRDEPLLIYLPKLYEVENRLFVAIGQHRPHAIIVGNNAVGDETLKEWRSVMGDQSQLTLIRRGSSLSRIATRQAKQLNITVLNTPSVNSRFVAEYMIDELKLPAEGFCPTVAIIGSGAIGSRVAQRLNAANHKVIIYSPSLSAANESDLERIRRRKGIASENIRIAPTPENAVEGVTHVVIAIDADRVTDVSQQLSRRFFELIPNNARLVSVTEFCVFAEGALDVLVERVRQGQLCALLDSHPFDLVRIENSPRQLNAVSAAMKGIGCGEAMDQAALILLSNVALKQSFGSPLSYFLMSEEKRGEVTIIGAGIAGLVCALVLAQDGYSVTVIDEHAPPILSSKSASNQLFCQGTAFDGCDARQASMTETMPHALPHRLDSLRLEPNKRGWRIIDEKLEPKEKAWIDRFTQLAGHPELVADLFSQFVANINRRGLKFWEDLFRMILQPEKDAVNTHRIIRVCPNAVSLNVVESYQNNYHLNEDNVGRLSRAQVLDRLPGLILTDGDAGGIEVPGFGVSVQQLSSNLIDYLEQKEQVTFRWSTQVKTLDDLSSKVVLASELCRIDSDLVNVVSQAVQGVIECWIKLPNVHSIGHAFKITEQDPMGVMNVTPSFDGKNLFVTGGFGFTGHRESLRSRRRDQLIDIFHDTIRHYLPREYEAGESKSRLTKLYFRPMTPDGMPIVTELTNENSHKQQVYYVGGSNSGGFVQAPILATLLIDLMRGQTSDSILHHVHRSLDVNRDTLKLQVN